MTSWLTHKLTPITWRQTRRQSTVRWSRFSPLRSSSLLAANASIMERTHDQLCSWMTQNYFQKVTNSWHNEGRWLWPKSCQPAHFKLIPYNIVSIINGILLVVKRVNGTITRNSKATFSLHLFFFLPQVGEFQYGQRTTVTGQHGSCRMASK